jgi:hypothetical protein
VDYVSIGLILKTALGAESRIGYNNIVYLLLFIIRQYTYKWLVGLNCCPDYRLSDGLHLFASRYLQHPSAVVLSFFVPLAIIGKES